MVLLNGQALQDASCDHIVKPTHANLTLFCMLLAQPDPGIINNNNNYNNSNNNNAFQLMMS